MINHRLIIAFVLGYVSIVAQLVLMREFANVLSGNELVVGIILACWLLLTGIGSLCGNRYIKSRWRNRIISIGTLAIGAYIPVSLLALRLIKAIYLSGSIVSLSTTIFIVSGLLLPYCLISGLVLTLLTGRDKTADMAQQPRQSPTNVFLLDTLGSILGGLIFTFYMVEATTPFEVAFALACILLLASALFTIKAEGLTWGLAPLALAALSTFFYAQSPKIELWTISRIGSFPVKRSLVR
jgi:spermidine synthase